MNKQNSNSNLENKSLKKCWSQSSLSSDSSKSKLPKSDVQQYYNRNVWHVTSTAAKTKIESRAKQLEKISQEIHAINDGSHHEKEAHKYLCEILRIIGCDVHSSYIHPTAFKAVLQSKQRSEKELLNAPTVGLICEYDAVPGFGHSCGHNLSTETTIGAVIGIRAAMKADTRLVGKLVILGTPVTEENGGKIQMMREDVFDKIDVIIAIHPNTYNCLFPKFYVSQKTKIIFTGISRHIDCLNTIHGNNPIDAAVLCYTNAMLTSNQIQPKCRIHGIIKRGGDVDYLVPKESELVFTIRAPTLQDLDFINKRLVDCGEAAAQTTQTKVDFQFLESELYTNVVHNKVLATIFKEEAKNVGIDYNSQPESDLLIYRSTDLGNVSHKVPLIYPSFSIGSSAIVHTKQFTDDVLKPEAQSKTIKASIALSMTIIKYLLTPTLQQEIKNQFQADKQELFKQLLINKINYN